MWTKEIWLLVSLLHVFAMSSTWLHGNLLTGLWCPFTKGQLRATCWTRLIVLLFLDSPSKVSPCIAIFFFVVPYSFHFQIINSDVRCTKLEVSFSEPNSLNFFLVLVLSLTYLLCFLVFGMLVLLWCSITRLWGFHRTAAFMLRLHLPDHNFKNFHFQFIYI